MMKRYLCVWLPDWPLTRLRRARLGQKAGTTQRLASLSADTPDNAPDKFSGPVRHPFVLLESGPHGLRVVAANASARARGVSEGLRFTDARARCPSLLSEQIDRQADADALRALGDWFIRIAPLIAIDGADGLMIETTGCAHLYGGECAMLAEVSRLLERDGLGHRLGLAGTVGAASALARAENEARVLGSGEEAAGLADLPISALRLSADAHTLLCRFGLTRIGQLYRIDRTALARRFRSRALAEDVLLRLDQALGRRVEPLAPLRPPPDHTARLACPEPIFTREAIEAGLEQLAEEICVRLSELGQGARGFTLHACRADGGVSAVRIALARPVRTPGHILHLFGEKLERIDPGFGIDLLLLEASRVAEMGAVSVPLSGDLATQAGDIEALSFLANRLGAKLGRASVAVRVPCASHLPERADRWDVFDGVMHEAGSPSPQNGPRPIRLLERPERVKVLAEVPDGPPQHFVWRKIRRTVSRADGPERIAPEWWRHTAPPPSAPAPDGTEQNWLAPKLDPRADAALIREVRAALETTEPPAPVKHLPRARDYYRVEDTDGRRYWLYRDGLYGDGRGGHPEWFVHGLFA